MRHKSFIYYIAFIGTLLINFSCDDEPALLQADFEASDTSIRAGEKVIFNDLTSANVSAWNWTFEGGEPSTSQLSQPEVTYPTKGTFTVSLEVYHKDGSLSVAKEQYITVGNSQVVADFSSSTTNTMNDEPVTFTDLSTGSVDNRKWTFTTQDGHTETSTEKNPEIIFTVPGIYSVQLEVSNAEFSDSKTIENYITVIDASNVITDFTSNITFTYTGGKISFSDTSVGRITSWLWEFEGADITTSTEQHPVVTFTTAGKHRVKLTASNGTLSQTILREDYIKVISSEELSVFFRFDGEIREELHPAINSKIEQLGTISFDITDRNGLSGKAANFAGTGGFIVKDDELFNLGTSNYTISIWLKVTEENSTTRMVPWQESGALGSKDNQTWLRLYSTSTNQLTFATEDENGGSTIHLTAANSPEVNNIANGAWRHVVCVRAGTETSLYVDGIERRRVTTSAVKNVSNAGDFKVGFQESGYGNYINKYIGAMDDLIIYRRALSSQEIADLFTK